MKYQRYFSAYYSDGLRTPVELYDELFSVDYTLG